MIHLILNLTTLKKRIIPGYGMTCHCSQGLTIDESYKIHEFDRMDIKLHYVALSR